MENNRLGLRFRKGTVAVGALAIIAIFTIIMSCITVIVMEYSRFAYNVKSANESVAAKAKENLAVQASASDGETTFTVTNTGSTPSLIVGVYAVNPADNNPTYYKLSQPVSVGILGEKTFNILHPILDGWEVGVLTSLGNVFWKSQAAVQPPIPPEPWLQGWQYRKSHTILRAAGAGTNYQIRVKAYFGSGADVGENVYLNGKSRQDFGDIRFTDVDKITPLSYWMEEKADGSYAVFWVKVQGDLAATDQTIYVYYGRNDATTTSKGEATFPELFTHFEGTGLPTGWADWYTEYGTRTVADSLLKLDGSTGAVGVWQNRAVRTTTLFGLDRCLMFKVHTLVYSNRHIPDMGIADRPDEKSPTNRAVWLASWDNSWQGFSTVKNGYGTSTAFTIKAGDVVWIARRSDLAKYYTNGIIRATHTTNVPTADLYAYFGIRRGALTSPQPEKVYIDWVAVRKWVDPDPSHGSWGTEETTYPSEPEIRDFIYDTFDLDLGGWTYWGDSGYSLTQDIGIGQPAPSAGISGDGFVVSAGMQKAVDISSWTGTGELTLSFNWRAASGYSGSTVTNAQLKIEDADSGVSLYTETLVAGGTTDIGWGSYSKDISTIVKGHVSFRIVLYLGDGWIANWNQKNWYDNIRLTGLSV